ncbi:MAG TPA: peptidase, partial [Ruminococcaceae bacterium]|nr:peptidase [Oscillospiraceae bacterium]
MFYNLFDPYYWILIVPSLLLALWAQMMVSSNFKKYSQVYNRRGYTGADAARMILDSNGLYHVRIERVSGNLTDHYDPKAEVIRLSDSVYGSASVAAVGVAPHEAGHAVQHATGYLPIKIRSA